MSGFLCSMVGATFGVAAAAEVIRLKKGITAVGNAQIDTAQSKFGGSSALFDGTGDHLLISGSSDWRWNTTNYTIEFWTRVNTHVNTGSNNLPAQIGSMNPNSGTAFWNFGTDDVGKITFHYYNGAVTKVAGSTNLSTGVQYHLAMVYTSSDNTIKLYVDGTQAASAVVSGTPQFSDSLALCLGQYNSVGYNGHIDEVRISKSARYTTGFTPSTTPFVNDDNTLLLLHMDGTDASTFFEDDNGVRAPKSLIANGNAQIDTAQSQFGGSSYQGDGTGDSILADNLASGITGDYTFECWVRFNALPSSGAFMMLATGDGNRYFGLLNNAGTQRWESSVMNASANQYVARYTPTITTGVWYHIALVKSGSTLTLYHNGTSQTATTIAGSMTSTSTLFTSSTNILGAYTSNNYSLNGWMDEVRISNTARYTANFTPATEPFVNDSNTLLLMHCDGTDGQTVFRDDNGLVSATYTSDVVAFDGTGDYYDATSLSSSVTADSKYALIALNLYWAGGNNLQHPFNIRLGTGSGDYGFWVWINGGRSQLKFVTGTGSVPGSIYENTENSLTANAWNQIVIWVDTTSSTTSQIWINGNSKAYSNDGFPTGALFNWTNTASTVKIGQKNTSQTGDGNDFNGRISQVYLSAASTFPGIEYFWDKSTNRPKDLGTTGTSTGLAQPLIYHYGDASTFPTNRGNFASYTLTANGGVTTNAANTIYARARRQRGIQALGNAQVSTAQSKFGGSSALFDGTGDYIRCLPAALFPTDNFTIEFWVRFVTVNTDRILAAGYESSASTENWAFYVSGTSKLVYYLSSVGGAWDIASGVQFSATTLTTNTWYHAALVRNGTTFTPYFDGVAGTTTTSSAAIYPTTDGFFFGGISGTAVNCYIDEVRISNTARYTANFTPSTAPFQNDSNTLLLLHMDGTNASTVFFDDNGRDTTPT